MMDKVEIPMGGGGVIRCDATLEPSIIAIRDQMNNDAEQFHKILMALGVKAYRCNDGWVNRDACCAHFFKEERTPGWYYSGDMNIKAGDLIAIGNVEEGAMILKAMDGIRKYSFNCIDVPFGEEVIAIVDGVVKGKRVPSHYRVKPLSLLLKILSALGKKDSHTIPVY